MKKKRKKLRPLGQIFLDMEPYIQEMMDGHDLQHGDFIGLMNDYLLRHYPYRIEEYLNGTVPQLHYTAAKRKQK